MKETPYGRPARPHVQKKFAMIPFVRRTALILAVFCFPFLCRVSHASKPLAPGEVWKIAEEAIIYGYPLIANYTIMNESFRDRRASGGDVPLNRIENVARVFTPEDTRVVTPNSDTPYSFFCADLRAEPVVFSVPDVEPGRYFSVQLVDWYTFNFGYVGTRTTGNRAGNFLIVGPYWDGDVPEGISKVFRSETEFALAIFRTQLFHPDDLENVKAVQSGYRVQTLSEFLNEPPPPPAPRIQWPTITKELARNNPFHYLSFVLQFCPPVGPAEVEKPLRERFARIGIEAGKPFSMDHLTPLQKVELLAGLKSGMQKIEEQVEKFGRHENGWRVATSGIGDRSVYNGNWLFRAAVAKVGIYANDPEEAVYPLLLKATNGELPDCSKHAYTLTFPPGALPPVKAFWSVTMYDARTQLLVRNPIDRYLINTSMLPNMKYNADGSLSLYLQKDSPGPEKESNWLPAPDGPIYVVMRLYLPRDEVLSGKWAPPAVVPVEPRSLSASGK